jgi:hypothetical protein
MDTRYMSSVYINDVSVLDGFGNDLQALMVSLMTHLDTENSQASGKIVDKDTGKTIYQCRKESD